MKNCKPKKKETVSSYIMRIISRPTFKRIPAKQLENNIKLINKDVDIEAVISQTNRCIHGYELVKIKIPDLKGQYYVLRRIVNSLDKEPFIPNDNLLKQRKIDFQNTRVVLPLKEYTKSPFSEKQKELQIGIKNIALVDKEKNLQKLNADNYDQILKKISKGVLAYEVSKLPKEDRLTVLVKYYEASETNHSFTVFKQSYLNFLNDTLLQDSIYNRRIFEFLKNEIKKK